MRMASGTEPRMGRKRPPTIPGPRITHKRSLPLDKNVAALNIMYPYTRMRKRLPITEVVQGKNPYVWSHEESAAESQLRAR